MRTVKQVSDLTGISVRMLHHYDKIGLLKPTDFTKAGYRLYDDEALQTLQQILFFKELHIPLKEIKDIMNSAHFDKMKSLEKQKKLIILKRDRLNNLIDLINKTLKGENTISFEEFDMNEYFNVLEEFKTEHEDKVIKLWGSVHKYNDYIEKVKSNKDKLAKTAIKQYGSIKKYAEATKNNLNNSNMLNLSEKYEEFKNDFLKDNHPKLKELFKKLTSDLTKDPSSKDIQKIAEEITTIAKKDYEAFNMVNGDEHWYYMTNLYSAYPDWIEKVDKKYGKGASKFIGKSLKNYLGDNKPRREVLFENLMSDFTKDPHSKEIQQIIKEIDSINKNRQETCKMDIGDNYFGSLAHFYLSDSNFIKITDEKYGKGTSKFLGEAFKFYGENNK